MPKYLKEIPEPPYEGSYTVDVDVEGDNFKVIGPGPGDTESRGNAGDTESGENAGDTESGGNG